MEVEFTRWGTNVVLQELERGAKECKIKILVVEAGQNISYQTHSKRAEIWTVVDGSGTLVQDGAFYEIKQGHSVHIPVGSKHAVKAGKEGIEIVEVQFGDECSEEDINRIYMGWESIKRFAEEDELIG